jgi:transposase
VVQVFRAVRSRRGDKGRNDRRFLEALHYFTLHNINWRALPAEFGNWNSVWMVDSQTTNSALSVTVS